MLLGVACSLKVTQLSDNCCSCGNKLVCVTMSLVLARMVMHEAQITGELEMAGATGTCSCSATSWPQGKCVSVIAIATSSAQNKRGLVGSKVAISQSSSLTCSVHWGCHQPYKLIDVIMTRSEHLWGSALPSGPLSSPFSGSVSPSVRPLEL